MTVYSLHGFVNSTSQFVEAHKQARHAAALQDELRHREAEEVLST
jgi:23S rRNA maturation mini-RNase III